MRKLKLQVQMTIDGFIAGVNGEMDWMTLNWSDDLIEYVKKITLIGDLHYQILIQNLIKIFQKDFGHLKHLI